MARGRVKHLPGRVTATDAEILAAWQSGMFLHQIQTKYIIGLPRLRRITRAYDAKAGAVAC